ncbi:LacI family DNA-binding transcriptional regulator [Pseudonocardia ailaonensis]|uniref:LacI family DNA-binding transcriptional regulator n=1 Tax=Pseudonocardia ailaonensis TaxID=367279 RepID=UPI0031CF8D4C
MTARDVARAAGVSQATVSFVLNERADQSISEGTRRAVLEAVHRLGYVPSGAARSLRRGRSNVVLCLIPDIPVSQAMEEFRRTLSQVLGESGLTCVFLHTEGGMRLAELWPHVHPAVVLSFGRLDDADAEQIRRTGVALVDDVLGPNGVAAHGLDQAQVGDLQVRHLAARGHTRLGYGAVVDPREDAIAGQRLCGAEEACRALGLPAPVVVPVDYTPESGLEAVGRWTAAGVTAVAAFNDIVALALLSGARALGLDVPGRLAVVGVDDLPVAALARPALTSVAIHATVPATALATLILAEAGKPAPAGSPPGPALRLVVRGSS